MILVIPWTAWLLNLAAPLDNLWTNQYSLNNPFSAHTRQTPFLLFVMRLPGWYQFSSVQLLSRVRLFATPWTAARQASLSITNSWSLLILMSIELVMPSNHLILCHSILLPPSLFPSIRVFCNESVLRIRWPKYWSFSFSISPSSEHPGLISFRMDWLDLLAVQRTLKSLLQHHKKESWALKNWCLWTVVLEQTLESPILQMKKLEALASWSEPCGWSVGSRLDAPPCLLCAPRLPKQLSAVSAGHQQTADHCDIKFHCLLY